MGDITYRHINMDRGEWPQGREKGKPKGQGENSARRTVNSHSTHEITREIGQEDSRRVGTQETEL